MSIYLFRSRGGSVSIVTRLRDGRLGLDISGRDWEIFPLPPRPDRQ